MGNLSPIVSEFASAEEESAYQLWFAAKVTASLSDVRPTLPHADAMAELDLLIDRAEKSPPDQ